jgi:PAS domain S-box-containing protein
MPHTSVDKSKFSTQEVTEDDDWNEAPVILWVTSLNGRFLRANLASSELMGYDAFEIAKLSLDEVFVVPLYFKDLKHCLEKAVKVTDWEATVRCKDGSTRNVLIDAKCHGDLIHYSVRDHSVTKRTEDYVREQVEFFARNKEAIIVQSLDGKVIHWSKMAEELYGLNPTSLIGQELPVEYRADKDQISAARNAVIKYGEWEGELRQRRATGEELHVQSRWVLVTDSTGVAQSILTINSDAAEIRSLEEKRLRIQRQDCLGMLAGGIAHDLNNILQPVAMSVEMLQESRPDSESHEILDMMSGNLRRASELIRHILKFTVGSRSEPSVVELEPLFKEVGNIIRQSFPKAIHFKMRVQEDLGAVLGDATQIEQILLNLCVNARDAMPSGGILQLLAENFLVNQEFASRHSGARDGNYVKISISDTGVGIPLPIRKKIFEPFFTTKGPESGTGLGLSTVYGIVQTHGGFLVLETEEGKGTTFEVYLPSFRAVSIQKSEPVKKPALLQGSGEFILLVDDESAVLKVMQRSLEKSGYGVLVATDGEQGLEIYKKRRDDIRVVITDMAMPGMDGPDLIAALHSINPKLKIICTSGLSLPNGAHTTRDLGVTATLSKPCNSRDILEAIKLALGPNNKP